MNKYEVKENMHLFNDLVCFKFDCWYKTDGIILHRYIFSNNLISAIKIFKIIYPTMDYDEPYEYNVDEFIFNTNHMCQPMKCNINQFKYRLLDELQLLNINLYNLTQ